MITSPAAAPLTFADLRAELPLTTNVGYFQTGSAGLTPDSVTQLVYETLLFLNHQGLAVPETQAILQQREAEAKQKLADFLQVTVAEIAWQPNTSQALHKVLHGMRWQPGDEFVVTSAEHVSVQGACQALARHYGVVIKTIPAAEGEDRLLTALKAALSARTRLVCISDVATVDGRRLPVGEVVRQAQAQGVPVLADVAQSVGQCRVDLGALGCDFAIGSIHKWMLGTKGLGFLYVKQSRLAEFVPDFIPDYHPWTKLDDPLPPIEAATRADQGIFDYASRISVGRTVDILNGLGIGRIEAHCRQLAQLFCAEAGQWPGVNVLVPEPTTGLCCLNFASYDERRVRELIARLLAAQLVVKYQPEPNGIRVSLAAFNTVAEVERLLVALRRLLF